MDDHSQRTLRARPDRSYRNTEQAALHPGVPERFVRALRSKSEDPAHRLHAFLVQYHFRYLPNWFESYGAEAVS